MSIPNIWDAYLGDFGNPRYGLWGYEPLSAAGRMLQRIERADADAQVCPVTDELLAALRRADLKGRWAA